ncbi:N-acetylmuramoyl-L-alanine amidase [Deinococcus marmoris]|uniref:N-acetylmuramoyl-L-alanine amidase n=1 Tax=Deinococcus marmoris TaxID=249408 RepID=UPI000495C8A3|nr:peptidoglycan recognition family protein [Deinococcus marmoris]
MNIEQYPAHPGNFSKGREGVKVDRIVCHVTDGGFSGTLAWFADPACNTSAHFTIAMDGRIAQHVPLTDTAWHSGLWAMNLRSVGIEHEGQPSKGPWTPSALQLAASAELTTTLCRQFGIPADRQHLIGHNEVQPGRAARANCPGKTWPWDAYVRDVQARLTPSPPAHVPDALDKRALRLFDPETNTQIGTASLINGTDKAYLTPETLASLRKGK